MLCINNKVITAKGGQMGRSWSNGTGWCVRRKDWDTDRHRAKTIWGHKRKAAAICEPRRKAPGETSSANALLSEFWTLEMWDSQFLLFKPPSLWHFATAVHKDQYTCFCHPVCLIRMDWYFLMWERNRKKGVPWCTAAAWLLRKGGHSCVPGI